MKQISIGKVRGLQRSSTPDGRFNILAIDHHDALRRALNPDAPESVTFDDMVAFKRQVVTVLAPEASGVLLDPIYGAAQAVAGGYLAQAGLLLELEKADYALKPIPLLNEILPGWGVDKIKRMGGDGVKLFYYYNCDDPERAPQQDALLAAIVTMCDAADLPFYAEPILYPLDEPAEVHQTYFTERVIRAAQRVEALGADILKMEFPLDSSQWHDPSAMRQACQALHAATTVPWALLSAGVDFETFCLQVEIACEAGASGIIGGRAVWGEATQIRDGQERQHWLETVGRERMRRLGSLIQRGRSWTERLGPVPVTTGWYQHYSGM